jgi:hypothetical protein
VPPPDLVNVAAVVEEAVIVTRFPDVPFTVQFATVVTEPDVKFIVWATVLVLVMEAKVLLPDIVRVDMPVDPPIVKVP